MRNKIGRRQFIKSLPIKGAVISVAVQSAPAILAQKKPNDRLGIACIGVGTQGHYLMQYVQQVPNTEVRVICDLYEGNKRRAQALCKNPKVRFVQEWEKAVLDPEIDAVIIATPDFWHAPMVIGAAKAKKDIYVEKGWCTRLEDAKKMRKAVKENKVIMQLGHQYNSLPFFHKAREIFRSGTLGKVPLVRTYIDRSDPTPMWKFYTDYSIHEMPKDASPTTIDWKRFIANAPKRPFDAERFFTWRCYWDYGTAIAGDLLSHLWDGVNMIMEMGIPESAVTQGGTYFWEGDRDVPDMWHVCYDYPRQKLAVTFGCGFHNRHVGEVIQILGREQTLEVSPRFCRTYGAEWKPEFDEKIKSIRPKETPLGFEEQDAVVPPDYSMKAGEIEVSSHMTNFIDCIRSREKPRCDVDRAFQEAAALLMSVEAFKKGRKVRWDASKEEIV